jgi:cholesterol oxidase
LRILETLSTRPFRGERPSATRRREWAQKCSPTAIRVQNNHKQCAQRCTRQKQQSTTTVNNGGGVHMSGFTRRGFLGGAAAAAATVAMPSAALARGTRVPITRSQERVVVIGSGFGGGVAALRLGQAGVPVLVLERGRWWPTGPNAETFPHASTPDKRDLFYSVWPEYKGRRIGLEPYVGLLEPVVGQNLTAVVAAGVGGGSLVYQGMTLQPTEELFNSWFPEQLDYAQMNSVFYPRVAQMLQIETAPDALINSPTYLPPRMFASQVQAAGYELTKIPMPIDWRYALAELKGRMNPSYTNGDCALGVNNGGKHSVDVTYIAQALATGNVRVAAKHNVTSIARAANGGWEVCVDRTDSRGTVVEQKIITTGALILSAGTVNTSRLLMRAGATGQITDLPDGLGQGYGTNGDQIYIWTDFAEDPGAPQGGPVVYGSYEWNDPSQPANTIIQASIPPSYKSSSTGSALPSLLVPGAEAATGTARDLHSTMLVGYGVSSDRGQFVYDSAKDKVELQWPAGGDAALAGRIHERLKAVAGRGSTLINTNNFVNSTWHSLGGACIDVVCDLEGRVKGQRGLYVLDGALMPGTTCACNPSMTIAAVVERALDQIVQTDVGSII